MLETKLGAIQQKARWYIFLKSRRSHVTPILPAHNILKIDQIICQEGIFATNIKDYKYSLKMDHILFSAVIVFLSFLRSCFLFLDAIASLAPTHVSPTVSH